MPLLLTGDPLGNPFVSNGQVAPAAAKLCAPGAECVDIALVNNMPDLALEGTERQFLTLLDAAARDVGVRVTFVSIPEVPRSACARDYMSGTYCDINRLWQRRFDGIIVTGNEPRAARLNDEPYWPTLARLIDWAQSNSIASIWSCLAAHAAVLHLNGIERRPLPDKCSGVYEFARVARHPMLAGVSSRLRIPHSRYNELAPDDLRSGGYTILTQSEEGGVDTFVREGESLMIFFQGHPEYESNTLLREFRRDVGRFVRRERDSYPAIPTGSFDAVSIEQLTEFGKRARSDRREDLLASFPTKAVEQRLTAPWRRSAIRLFRNWLGYIRAQKARQASTVTPGDVEPARVASI
jgi:homoserine O-succinyltransferase/O-acetyltransferase